MRAVFGRDSVFNQHGGEISPGFRLLMSQDSGNPGTIYYSLDGSDPRLWGGAVSPDALVYSPAEEILLDDTTTVMARGASGER